MNTFKTLFAAAALSLSLIAPATFAQDKGPVGIAMPTMPLSCARTGPASSENPIPSAAASFITFILRFSSPTAPYVRGTDCFSPMW